MPSTIIDRHSISIPIQRNAISIVQTAVKGQQVRENPGRNEAKCFEVGFIMRSVFDGDWSVFNTWC
jgi:hypothetical protein